MVRENIVGNRSSLLSNFFDISNVLSTPSGGELASLVAASNELKGVGNGHGRATSSSLT